MVIIILNHCVAEMNINLTLYLLRFQDNISGNYDAFEDSKFKGTILVNIKLLGDLISNLYLKKNIYIYMGACPSFLSYSQILTPM